MTNQQKKDCRKITLKYISLASKKNLTDTEIMACLVEMSISLAKVLNVTFSEDEAERFIHDVINIDHEIMIYQLSKKLPVIVSSEIPHEYMLFKKVSDAVLNALDEKQN